MFRIIFLLIVIVSAIEIVLFIWLGNLFNVWFVLVGIILTGILGALLAKYQGLETLRRAQFELANGRAPREEIFDGIAILIGAIVLFTPGFLTDLFGFLLLIPSTRNPIKRWGQRMIYSLIKRGSVTVIRR
ncbi:FxsA family protein [Alkalibacillus aidingensis]|uniref:FxsA family protein n=1 Tax=Alkalibacillus aidingensis TaxID=2747607 RepID=UPI001660B476|nr:FxsA family protein [Alkalibacillus aidingensis]